MPVRSGRKLLRSVKRSKSSIRDDSSGTLTPQSNPQILPPILNDSDASSAAAQDTYMAQQLQAKATAIAKARWIGRRKEFAEHLNEIRVSNDFIRDIFSLRALGTIRNALVGLEYDGEVPDDILAVQDSLRRLHHVLTNLNQGSSGQTPATISIRVMDAAGYLRLQKRLAAQHDYIGFRKDSALYPLQIKPVTAVPSTVVIAETLIKPQLSSAPRVELDTIVPLSQMLHGPSTDAFEAFEKIGTIADDHSPGDIHCLYEDISTSWTVQITLASLIQSESRFRTFMQLALQVSVSYMFFGSITTTHRYPRLIDYQYYKEALDSDLSLGPNDVLEPYLCVGFGARAPRRSTKDIGGTGGYIAGDEIMTSLGIILHQLGCT